MTSEGALLSELCRVQIGRTPRRDEPAFWNGSNPWASVRDLTDGHVRETREGISDSAVSSVMPPITSKGTLLVSFKLTIGRVAIAGRNMHHNEAIASLPIIRPDLVERDYLRHVLPRVMEREQTNIAVLGHVLNKAKLQSLPIPLPPLDEQRRIVGLLDRATEIRRRAEAARAKARAIIPALFLDTFGDPATNPKRWPIVPLGGVIERIIGGKNLLAGNGSSRYRIMKVSAVTSGVLRPDESKPAPDGYEPAPEHLVREGDFLFSRANTAELVGAVAMAHNPPEGLLLPDKVWRIEWDRTRISPTYAYSLLRTSEIRRIFAIIASGTSDSMKNISQAKLSRVPIGVPPVTLQITYAKQAQRIEQLSRSLDATSAKAETMAAALSAEVFE